MSSSSPRSAISRQRIRQSPPPTSSTSTLRPASRSEAATLSPIPGSAAAAPPPRLRSTVMGVIARQRPEGRSLSLLARALADSARIDVHLHGHAILHALARALARHVHRVACRRVGARHAGGLAGALFLAHHLDVDL